jgi:hypothetical protein
VARLLLAQHHADFRVVRRAGPEALSTANGLVGKLWRRLGGRGGVERVHLIAILSSGGHTYLLQLESSAEAAPANEARFRAVIDSVRPLPLAPRALAQRTHAMQHWVE